MSIRILLAILIITVLGCETDPGAVSMVPGSNETFELSTEPVACTTVAYSIAQTSQQAAALIREAAEVWNAALGREALVERAGAPVVHVVGKDCPLTDPNAWGGCDADGAITLCASRIHGDPVSDAFRATAEHEFGHRLIGMVHLTDPIAIMAADGGGAMAPTDVDLSAVPCYYSR